MNKVVSLRIPSRVNQQLKFLSKLGSISRNKCINNLIKEVLEHPESVKLIADYEAHQKLLKERYEGINNKKISNQ